MFANMKTYAFIYDMQHQDYLNFTDKATFFQPQATTVTCFFVLKII
jgi:hypothetical protein